MRAIPLQMDDSSPRSAKFLIIVIFFIFTTLPSYRCNINEQFQECSRPYECGNLGISYPFWGGSRPQFCGHQGFEFRCVNDTFPVIEINDLGYRILNINQSNIGINHTMRIARLDFWDGPCSSNVHFINTTLDTALLDYARPVYNLTLFYGCTQLASSSGGFNYFTCYNGDIVFQATESISLDLAAEKCQKVVQLPILQTSDYGNYTSAEGGKAMTALGLEQLLNQGFDVEYTTIFRNTSCESCKRSGGICGSDNSSSTTKFLCFCRDRTEDSDCFALAGDGRNWKLKIGIGAASGGSAILLICLIACCLRFKIFTKSCSKMKKNDQGLEAFIRSYGHLPTKRYRFLDVKRMTNSFKEKLGQGGYGEVYKGKLLDGRLVAVKFLNASKGNGEEFINEVASISRTSHVNIVTLLGFCLEGHKRALIYEFMPNGSLEKFTYKDNPSQPTPHLKGEKLLQISIGIARGLEYLHRGCNIKILHLDIKPHNILLDEDFCPKIADFGLAKLCPRKDSIISMTNAGGTIGYIAPEVYNRNFGGVSSKSDVYSYGMMILEMVGGRKNIKVGVSRTSEIYFPDWIYKHLKLGRNLPLWEDITNEENEIARKLIMVGLWCIQNKQSDRPSMSKVIEMLEGSFEALHIPPNPSMFSPESPERLPNELLAESSTTAVE